MKIGHVRSREHGVQSVGTSWCSSDALQKWDVGGEQP